MRMGKVNLTGYTVIGPGAFFEGTISSKEKIRIDGRFKGKIECGGDLVISDAGNVEGDVVANGVIVAGELTGSVNAKECLHVSKSGKLYGDIFATRLVMEPGGIFEGNSHMLSQEQVPKLSTSLHLVGQGASA
jgi:cytoskeletal protein CcmA (bactofilin family)